MNDNVCTTLSICGGVATQISEGALVTLSAVVSITCGVIVIVKTTIRVVDTIRAYHDKRISAQEACENLDEVKEVLRDDVQRMD